MPDTIRKAADAVGQGGPAAVIGAAFATVLLGGVQWLYDLPPIPNGVEAGLATLAAAAFWGVGKVYRDWMRVRRCPDV